MSKSKEAPVKVECMGGCGKYQMIRRSKMNPKTGGQEEAGGGAGQPWRLGLLLTAVGIDLKAANLRVEAGAEAPRFSEGSMSLLHDRPKSQIWVMERIKLMAAEVIDLR